MKKTIFIILCWMTFYGWSQELPTVIPPSPTAASVHLNGNTAVGYYAGATQVSIPLYEIKEGDITIPITLQYTGSNGIKIEENSSWVGLGWSLSAAGAVSRVKRGVADDDFNRGMISYGNQGLPTPVQQGGVFTNQQLFKDISQGKKDGEPDKFYYNTPSVSGSFYLNYASNSYTLKPYQDIKIGYQYQPSTESINTATCYSDGVKVFDSFSLTDPYGMQYSFSEKERNNSKLQGGTFLDNACYPSTWYMTRIENRNKTHRVFFDYQPYTYTLRRLNTAIAAGEETVSYTEDVFIGKRLKKIQFTQGSVEFIASSSTRKDIANERYLEQIIVRDTRGQQIKKYTFSYGYFTDKRLITDAATIASLSVSNKNRLVLLRVTTSGKEQKSMPPYTFIYNTEVFLPDTFSKAKDHWGYYNGAHNNTSFEPKQFATYYHAPDGKWVTKVIGTANRNANSQYAQAGMLQQITYPTGGKTLFTYQGNTTTDNRLPRTVVSANKSLNHIYNSQNSATYTDFSVNLYSEAVTVSQMRITAFNYDPHQGCYPVVFIKNLDKGTLQQFSFEPTNSSTSPTGPSGGVQHTVLLPKGNYRAYYVMDSNSFSCAGSEPAIVSLRWDHETQNPTREVGGLRIAKIIDQTPSSPDVIRNYTYENQYGESSGELASIPAYYFQNWTKHPQTQQPVPLSIAKRTTTSNYPLTQTGGNTVGYTQVDEFTNDSVTATGKTSYFYFGAKQYPDVRNGFFQHNNRPDLITYAGKTIETYPVVTEDSREFLRGKLKKKKVFAYLQNQLTPVLEEDYSYKNLYFYYNRPDLAADHIQNAAYITKGLKVSFAEGQSIGNIKYYELYSGYSLPMQTKSQHFFENNKKTQQTTTETYATAANDLALHFIAETTQTTTSTGDHKTIKTIFPFSSGATASSNNTEREAIAQLIAQNALYLPIQTSNFNETTELSSQRNSFKKQAGDKVNLEIIKAAKGGLDLEERIKYHRYDTYGNPLEVSKASGTRIIYVWGYQNQLPVAKIENASYNDIAPYVANLKTVSNADTDHCRQPGCKEQLLREALDNVREQFPDAMVTSYTYDPLIGVTSITDSRGNTIYHTYDAFNRLSYTEDHNGHVLQKYSYNYDGEKEATYGAFSIAIDGATQGQPEQAIPYTASVSRNGNSERFIYTWWVDNIEVSCGGQSQINRTFNQQGNHQIRLKVVDTQTKEAKTVSKNIQIAYPVFQTPVVTASSTHTIKGTPIVFTTTSGGGSGSLQYQWYVNNSLQHDTDSRFDFSNTTAGTYSVYCKVTDTKTGTSKNSAVKKVYTYNALSTPELAVSKTAVLKGTKVTYTASGISGGSGSYTYQWYVNNSLQNVNSTTLSYTHTTTGAFSVYLKVVDTKVASHTKNTTTKKVNVYNSLATPNLTSNHTYLVKGTTVTFTASGINGGSGARRNEWYVNNSKQSYTGTKLQKAFPNTGRYIIKYRVVDTKIAGHYKEKTKVILVYNPLNTPSLTANKTYILKGNTVSFNTSGIAGGSDKRRYEWYINNVKQSATGVSFAYKFSNKGTYTIKMKVIDTRIANHSKWSNSRTVYVYDPMRVTISPTSTTLTNSRPSVTFKQTSISGGSGKHLIVWKLERKSTPTWTRIVGNGTSYKMGTSQNGQYELSVTYNDTRTGEVVVKTMPVKVSKSSSGGGGDGDGGPGQEL